tara:strand:+ start:1185 stop:1466 length:282 start_codon:yes stop_codon:yes gene_type:complete
MNKLSSSTIDISVGVTPKSAQMFFCAFISSVCTFIGKSWKNISSSTMSGKQATWATKNADSIALNADCFLFIILPPLGTKHCNINIIKKKVFV